MRRTAPPCRLLVAARPWRHPRSSDACTTTLTRPCRAGRAAGRALGIVTGRRECPAEEGERRTAAGERDPEDSVGVFRPGGAGPPTSVVVSYIDDYRKKF